MKRLHKLVGWISLLMIIPLALIFFYAIYSVNWIVKTDLSDVEIAEICSTFGFELKDSETVYLEYYPGMGQAYPWLKVNIENVQSESEFLSRFHGTIKKTENYLATNSYYVRTCEQGEIQKSYHINFLDESGERTVEISVMGILSDYNAIIDPLYYKSKPYYADWTFRILLYIEFALIVFLIILVPIRIIKKLWPSQRRAALSETNQENNKDNAV